MKVRQPFYLRADDVPVPEGWTARRILDCYEQLPVGERFDLKTVSEDGRIPVIDQSEAGIIGYHDEEPGVYASPESPVFTFANHTCAMRLIEQPFSVIQNVFPMQGIAGETDTVFLRYATLGRQLTEEYKGHHPAWRNSFIPLPPLEKQRRIGAYLRRFDNLIAANRRRIEILEEMARLIYWEWFAHFRFPGHEDVELVDSDLGQLPRGWETKAIDDVAELVRGRSYRGTDLVKPPGGRPFLNLKCIDRGGGFRKSGLKRYTGPFKEQQLARPGDTVIAVTDMTQDRNIVAQAGRVPSLSEASGVISLDLVRVLPRATIDGDYLHAMFRYSNFSNEVREHANGTNVLHLSPDRIREFRFAVPPPELQKSFRQAVRPMYDLVDNLGLQNETLAETRDLLLPRLISGELNVAQLDLDLEPVA